MAMKCGIHFCFEAEIVHPSKISPTRVSWEWNDVPDVVKTSAKRIILSKPRPNPLCFTDPKRLRSKYHSYGFKGRSASRIL